LAGAIDKLPDLGITWRREASEALRVAGFRGVWPAGLGRVAEAGGRAEAIQAAREDFTTRPRECWSHNVTRLLACDAGLFRLSPAAGQGTLAELHLACAAGVPVVCWWCDQQTFEGESASAEFCELSQAVWMATCEELDLDTAIARLREVLGAGGDPPMAILDANVDIRAELLALGCDAKEVEALRREVEQEGGKA
jgi:nucleoside 2-deoxyribosyltransferase